MGKNEWISVEDRLPEDDCNVKKHSDAHMELCSVIAYGKLSGGFGKVVKETNRYVTYETGIEYIDEITKNEGREFRKWYWSDGWEEVTHWMPLPQSPEV